MTFDTYTDILKRYCSEDKPEVALNALTLMFSQLEDQPGGGHQSKVLMLASQLNRLRDQELRGLAQDAFQRNRIIDACIDLLILLEKDRDIVDFFFKNHHKIVNQTISLFPPKPNVPIPDDTTVKVHKLSLKLILSTDDHRSPAPVIELTEEALVGRLAECSVTLNDRRISRRHARIFFEEDSLWVEDLGSDNGTYVDGEEVRGKTALFSGCMLSFNDISFEVTIQ